MLTIAGSIYSREEGFSIQVDCRMPDAVTERESAQVVIKFPDKSKWVGSMKQLEKNLKRNVK